MSTWVRLKATAKGPGLWLLWHRRGLGKDKADRSGNCRELRDAEADGIAPVKSCLKELIMQTLYSVSRPTSLGLAFRTLHLIDTCLFAVMQPHLYYSTTHCTRAADTFVELLKGEEIAPIDKLPNKHVENQPGASRTRMDSNSLLVDKTRSIGVCSKPPAFDAPT